MAVLRRSGQLVTVASAAAALDLPRDKTAQLLARWSEQGWLKRLRRGIYSPVPLESAAADSTLARPWVLVPALFDPAYVGGWSAAEHWHLTEQVFRDTCVFTARDSSSRRVTVEGNTFVLHKTSQFFGLAAVWEGRIKVAVSDPHRTLIDMLDNPRTGGGIRHVEACLTTYLASSDSDIRRLLDYANTKGTGAVFKRLGFLLERSGKAGSETLGICKERLTKGNAALDPALPREKLITRWRLWVPRGWGERP